MIIFVPKSLPEKNAFGPVFVLMLVFFFMLSYQEAIETTAEELIETTHSLFSHSLHPSFTFIVPKKEQTKKSILPQRFSGSWILF